MALSCKEVVPGGQGGGGTLGLEHHHGLPQELALVLCCGNVTAAGCFLFQATVSPAAMLQSTQCFIDTAREP